MIGVAVRAGRSRGRQLYRINGQNVVFKGNRFELQFGRSPSLLSRSFSENSDDKGRGGAALKDLLKKMKSEGEGGDKAKNDRDDGKSAGEGQPKTETSERAEEEVDNTGNADDSGSGGGTDGDDKEDEKAAKEDDGAKFEMPRFDPELAQAFIASIPGRTRLLADSLMKNVKEAYSELQGKDKKTGLRTKVQQAESFRRGDASEEGEDKEEEKDKGPSELVHVKEAESEWEKMRQRLADNPLIREIFKGSKKAYNAAADTDIGQKVEDAGERVKEKIEDAKEFWETSQNPIVYTLSGVWDNMTGDTEEGIVLAEIMKLDPGFDKETWSEEVKVNLVPDLIKAHLRGDVELLTEHLGEGALHTLTQDIKLREADKVEIDTNLLDLDEVDIKIKYYEDSGPVIAVVYMVQQINCVRKRGEIIEGSEDAVVAKMYQLAFTQEYLEDEGEVRWKVVAYSMGEPTPYL